MTTLVFFDLFLDDENEWLCFECNTKLSSSEELQDHLNQHDDEINLQNNKGSLSKKQLKVLLPQRPENNDETNATTNNSVGSRDFRCPLCSKRFTKECSLNRHVILHHSEKKFSCDECDLKFTHSMNLVRHKKNVHCPDPNKIPTKCPTCRLWFKTSSVYRIHVFSHHPFFPLAVLSEDNVISIGNELESASECPECKVHFENVQDLVEHVEIHGSANLNETDDPKNGQIETKSIKKFKCEICHKYLSTDERLKVRLFL